MKGTHFSLFTMIAISLLLLVACGNGAPGEVGAPADDEADHEVNDETDEASYEGETVRFMVGYSPGGGTDLYARTIALHFGRHLPGAPDVTVENVPGASGLVLANQLYRTLPQDGTVIAFLIGELLLREVLGVEEVEWDDGRDFQMVGVYAGQRAVCVVHELSGVTSIADIQDADSPLVMGGQAPGDLTTNFPRLLGDLVDLPIELVTGYEGTAEMSLAMEQGEVDGACWGWEAMLGTSSEELSAGTFIPIVQSGFEPDPDLSDVPLFIDLVDEGPDRDLLEAAIDIPNETTRAVWAPPGVSEERMQLLRDAFMATLEDEEFLADAAAAGLVIDPRDAETVESQLSRFYELDEVTRERLREVLQLDA